MLSVSFGAHPSAPLHILCLGAHSDDIEIGCGGTLLRLLEERPDSTVDWVVLSANQERAEEAQASATSYLAGAGAKNVVLKTFRESYFPYIATDIKDTFEEIKHRINPDVVFCHHRHDVHQDHRLVGELAWNTFRNHLILEYEIAKYEGDLGMPNVFVPLSRKIAERKVTLLLQHFPSQAQRTWFHADTFHGLMSIRGIECNAAEGRAEAFHARKMCL